MASRPGRLVPIGLKKGSAWGTAAACGAGNMLLLNSEGLTGSRSREDLIDMPLGKTHPKYSVTGREAVSGALESHLRYEGNLPRLLAAAIGSDVFTIIGAGPAYLHTMEWQATNMGYFWTLVNGFNTTNCLEVPSLKVGGFTLAAAKGERLSASFPCLGSIVNNNTETTTNGLAIVPVNKPSTVATLTQATGESNIVTADGSALFQLAPFAGALATYKVLNTSLVFARTIEGAYELGDASMGISEPLPSGYDTAQLTVTFDTSNADVIALLDHLIQHNKLFGKITYQGALISGTDYYKLDIEMRHMVVNQAQTATTGPGKIGATVVFDLLGDNTTTHAGLRASNPDGPLSLYLTNVLATSLLA